MKRLALVLAALLLAAFSADAQTLTAGGCSATTHYGSGPHQALITFSCGEVIWFVEIRNTDRGLALGNVGTLQIEWNFPFSLYIVGQSVLKSASLAEIFVPYHNGIPSDRLSDVQHCTRPLCIRRLFPQDLGPNSMLITLPGETEPTIGAEIHDRGMAWLCKWPGGSRTRRGKELVLWGTWDPGNYDYVIEYRFRDDGQISFRFGATGWNNEGIGEDVAHMHDELWRVDIDANNSINTAKIAVHDEVGLAAFDTEGKFNGGVEGSMDLDEKRFATLLIESNVTNRAGHERAIELRPFREGTARHAEGWTQHDTWVTRYSKTDEDWSFGIPKYETPDTYLAGTSANQLGVFNKEPVENEDIVVWHLSSAHHDPHDEDQAEDDSTNGHKGLTLMHWSGFDLVPHNFFDFNPLGGPHRRHCDGPP